MCHSKKSFQRKVVKFGTDEKTINIKQLQNRKKRTPKIGLSNSYRDFQICH